MSSFTHRNFQTNLATSADFVVTSGAEKSDGWLKKKMIRAGTREYQTQRSSRETSLWNISADIFTVIRLLYDKTAPDCNSIPSARFFFLSFFELTITRDERSVVSALLVQFALLGGCFARRPLHEEVVFAESALPSCGGIQWLALLLEGAPGLFSVSLTFVGQEGGGAVFGVSSWECPKVVRVVIPTLRCRGAIIWIHGCHVAVWNAGLGVHA